MKIPAILYGKRREVMARMKRVVTALRRDMPFLVALEADHAIDTHEVPVIVPSAANGFASGGLILVGVPGAALGGQQHFHCYAPQWMIQDAVRTGRLPTEAEDQIFNICLDHSWGVLGLISTGNATWILDPSRKREIVRAAVRFWDELVAERDRYSTGSAHGANIWEAFTMLQGILAKLGVPEELLHYRRFPEGGIVPLVAMVAPELLPARPKH